MNTRFLLSLAAAGLLFAAAVASACTIPVFRYALERWEADRLRVIIYHRGPLAAADEAAVEELSKRSTLAGGPLNIDVLHFDLDSPQDFAAVAGSFAESQPPADRPLPWVEIRGTLNRRASVRWQGPLADVVRDARLFDSPARQELIRRLLAGDSSVWLVVAPQTQKDELAQRLQKQLDAVKPELILPAGIGTPGSEIYAPIPLEIRFSVLPIAQEDADEAAFLQQLASAANGFKPDGAYVIPVFGRLRALEVIPHAEVDDFVVRDIAEFLCAACSCRVKEANPGFDLLAATRWHERLFGDGDAPPSEAGQPPLATGDVAAAGDTPEYVAIPAGAAAGESVSSLAKNDSAHPSSSQGQESSSQLPAELPATTVFAVGPLLAVGVAMILAALAFTHTRRSL